MVRLTLKLSSAQLLLAFSGSAKLSSESSKNSPQCTQTQHKHIKHPCLWKQHISGINRTLGESTCSTKRRKNSNSGSESNQNHVHTPKDTLPACRSTHKRRLQNPTMRSNMSTNLFGCDGCQICCCFAPICFLWIMHLHRNLSLDTDVNAIWFHDWTNACRIQVAYRRS